MIDQISLTSGIEGSWYPKINKVQQIIKLFDELSDKDISYLDIELLQVIIDFKWDQYT